MAPSLAEGGKSYFFGFFSASAHLLWQLAQLPPQPPCQPPFWQMNRIASASSTKIIITTITLAISYTTSYVSVGVLSGAVHTRPNTVPTQCTTNATIHAIPHCIKTTPAAARAPPSSRLTAAIAATQGVYSRVNTRNTMAVNGVNSVVSAAVSPAQKDRQRRDNALLGRKAGNESRRHTPVLKAQRAEHRREDAPDGRKQAPAAVRHEIQVQVKRLQEPDGKRRHENDRKRALQEVARLVPQEHGHALERRQAIIRQLHDKRDGIAAEHRVIQQQRNEHADDHTAEVEQRHHEHSMLREECRREYGIDRDLGRAAHERRHQLIDWIAPIGLILFHFLILKKLTQIMDEVKTHWELNEIPQNEYLCHSHTNTSSSLGDNSAESILTFFSYAVLVLGLIGSIIIGIVVGDDNEALGWGCFFGGVVSVIITWAVCMVIINISNNIRQIKNIFKEEFDR